MAMQLLGPMKPFQGAQVADQGRWLVVFKHNQAVSLYSSGAKIRKLFDAPVFGAAVAMLDTTPQDLEVSIRDVRTLDGYRVARLAIHLQIRITPDEDGAAVALLRRINEEGEKFFNAVQATIRQQVEDRLRSSLGTIRAQDIVDQGPSAISFPRGVMVLKDIPFAVVTAIQRVDWEEASLAREVRLAEERRTADREKEQLEHEARESAARAATHQQALDSQLAIAQHILDSDLETRRLEQAIAKANRIGVDPLAIVEPQVWGQLVEQHSSVLTKLLESAHIYPLMRSSPELLSAILHRLSGVKSTMPLGRQADMVLDGIDPSRLHFSSTGTVHSQANSSAFLARAGLLIDPAVEEVWISSGGSSTLTGAGFAEAPGQKAALVLLLGVSEPSVPVKFEERLAERFREDGKEIERVGVKVASGASLEEAVQQFVHKISPSVTTVLVLRELRDRREAFVELQGEVEEARKVFKVMTDPQNPILPGLESLIGNRAQIRFASPEA